MEIDCSLDPNPDPELARDLFVFIRQTHGIHTRWNITTPGQLSAGPSVERRTNVSGGDSVARQRAPVRDSFDDEQRSDHLSNPWSC